MYRKSRFLKMSSGPSGQGLVEYVALTALVAILCIGTVKAFGSKVRSRLTQVTNAFDRNVQQGLKTRAGAADVSDEGEGETAAHPSANRGLRSILNQLPGLGGARR